jgi:hypothetical protein
MNNIATVSLSLLVWISLLISPSAQADPFPPGLYLNHSNPIPFGGGCLPRTMDKGTLTAVCPDFFGKDQVSILAAANTCAAEKHDIMNVNGVLTCVLSSHTVMPEHPYTSDIVSISHDIVNEQGETKVFRIDQPRVDVPSDDLRSITFKPGDIVRINGGGCVQTGGFGPHTWKSYINPKGSDAPEFYFGTVFINGVTLKPKGILALFDQPLRIPHPTDPKVAQEFFLQLGYQDTPGDYADNGYWNHDDGDDDQCKNTGPAFVVVTVVSGVPETTAVFSPHSKPFDLTWNENNMDFNNLPFNPLWGSQKDGRGTPDFKNSCGPAITDTFSPIIFPVPDFVDEGGTTINSETLAAQCSSQSPAADLKLEGAVIGGFFGYCKGILDGHMLWGIATYTGNLNWLEWSGNPAADNLDLADGDYNLTLEPLGGAGLISSGPTLGLEFNDDETVRIAKGPFWENLVNGAENGATPTPNQLFGNGSGLPGVVTGVVGVDGVHEDGAAEVHPVFALALNTAERDVDGTIEQDWVFFLHNFGNNGGCSENFSFWPSSLENNEYFIQLPWPTGAQSVGVLGAANFGKWQEGNVTGSVVAAVDPGFTLIDVQFDGAKEGHFGVDGSFTLRYLFPPDFKAPPRPLRPARPIRKDDEKEVTAANLISLVKDPALAAQFAKDLATLQPTSASPVKRIPVTFDTSMKQVKRRAPAPNKGQLTRPFIVPNTAAREHQDRLKALTDKYIPTTAAK